MEKRYYFDTSIWLDFWEKRNEPNLPKGRWAKELLERISAENGTIVYSDIVKKELMTKGYSFYDIRERFHSLRNILIFRRSRDAQWKRARDLSNKRDIPLFDALHALIARDSNAVMVTRDKHFMALLDIIDSRRPEDLL